MSLFSYQGSLFVAMLSSNFLYYIRLRFCLSRTFLTFFKSFFEVLLQLTQRVLILSLFFAVVNNFLNFLFFLFIQKKKYGEGGI